jgi:hypothetical protein
VSRVWRFLDDAEFLELLDDGKHVPIPIARKVQRALNQRLEVGLLMDHLVEWRFLRAPDPIQRIAVIEDLRRLKCRFEKDNECDNAQAKYRSASGDAVGFRFGHIQFHLSRTLLLGFLAHFVRFEHPASVPAIRRVLGAQKFHNAAVVFFDGNLSQGVGQVRGELPHVSAPVNRRLTFVNLNLLRTVASDQVHIRGEQQERHNAKDSPGPICHFHAHWMKPYAQQRDVTQP